jgi:hypothetical protein
LFLLSISAYALTLGGCDDALSGTDSGPVGGAQITHTQAQGMTLTVVDATSEKVWVYMRLRDGAQLDLPSAADPAADPTWDLAFRRYQVLLNGGVSGPGQVVGQWLDAVAFDDLSTAPPDGYLSDAPDGDDDNALPDLVLEHWYNYDFRTHTLTPRAGVYVLRDAAGQHYKLAFDGYYDAAGSPGRALTKRLPQDKDRGCRTSLREGAAHQDPDLASDCPRPPWPAVGWEGGQPVAVAIFGVLSRRPCVPTLSHPANSFFVSVHQREGRRRERVQESG